MNRVTDPGGSSCHDHRSMDKQNIQHVLEVWFATRERDAYNVDSRMSRWFDSDPEFDAALKEQFEGLCDDAAFDKLDAWAEHPLGRLALILLLDMFPRRIYRDTSQAYRGDKKALKLCEQGVAKDHFQKLTAIQQLFFFMPLQHAESKRVQKAAVKIYSSLARRVSGTQQATFETIAQFAELRSDIIEAHGRFPHRDQILDRGENTAKLLPVEDVELATP